MKQPRRHVVLFDFDGGAAGGEVSNNGKEAQLLALRTGNIVWAAALSSSSEEQSEWVWCESESDSGWAPRSFLQRVEGFERKPAPVKPTLAAFESALAMMQVADGEGQAQRSKSPHTARASRWFTPEVATVLCTVRADELVARTQRTGGTMSRFEFVSILTACLSEEMRSTPRLEWHLTRLFDSIANDAGGPLARGDDLFFAGSGTTSANSTASKTTTGEESSSISSSAPRCISSADALTTVVVFDGNHVGPGTMAQYIFDARCSAEGVLSEDALEQHLYRSFCLYIDACESPPARGEVFELGGETANAERSERAAVLARAVSRHACTVLPTLSTSPSKASTGSTSGRGLSFESFAAWHLATWELGEELGHGFQGRESPIRSMWGLSRMLQFLDFARIEAYLAELSGGTLLKGRKTESDSAIATKQQAAVAESRSAEIVAQLKLRRDSIRETTSTTTTTTERELSTVHRDLDALDLRLSNITSWPPPASPLNYERDPSSSPQRLLPLHVNRDDGDLTLPPHARVAAEAEGASNEQREARERAAEQQTPTPPEPPALPPMVTVEDAAKTVVAERARLAQERALGDQRIRDDFEVERTEWSAERAELEERCASAYASADESRDAVSKIAKEMSLMSITIAELRLDSEAEAATSAAKEEAELTLAAAAAAAAAAKMELVEKQLEARHMAEKEPAVESMSNAAWEEERTRHADEMHILVTQLEIARRQTLTNAEAMTKAKEHAHTHEVETARLRAEAKCLREESEAREREMSQLLSGNKILRAQLEAAQLTSREAEIEASDKLKGVLDRLKMAREEVRQHRARSTWIPGSVATAARAIHDPPGMEKVETTTTSQTTVATKTETREEFDLIISSTGFLGVSFSIDSATCMGVVHGTIDPNGAVQKEYPHELRSGDRLESLNGEQFQSITSFAPGGEGKLDLKELAKALQMTVRLLHDYPLVSPPSYLQFASNPPHSSFPALKRYYSSERP